MFIDHNNIAFFKAVREGIKINICVIIQQKDFQFVLIKEMTVVQCNVLVSCFQFICLKQKHNIKLNYFSHVQYCVKVLSSS